MSERGLVFCGTTNTSLNRDLGERPSGSREQASFYLLQDLKDKSSKPILLRLHFGLKDFIG